MFRVGASLAYPLPPAEAVAKTRRLPPKITSRKTPGYLPSRCLCRFCSQTRHKLPVFKNSGPFIFSNLQTLFPAANPQPSPFHALAHSFAQRKNVTPAFPITSELFVRSFAKERNSTPLLSAACGLFCEKWGWRPKFGLHFYYRDNDYDRPPAKTTASRGTFSTGLARPLALPRQPDLVYKLCQPFVIIRIDSRLWNARLIGRNQNETHQSICFHRFSLPRWCSAAGSALKLRPRSRYAPRCP